MNEKVYEVHYEDGEVYKTDFHESYKIFLAQHKGGRKCFVRPSSELYKEP